MFDEDLRLLNIPPKTTDPSHRKNDDERRDKPYTNDKSPLVTAEEVARRYKENSYD